MPTPCLLSRRSPDDATFDDVLPQVARCLATSPYLALRYIHCSRDGSRLILHGRVPSYYLKQLAQVMAGQCVNGRLIENRVEVA